MTAKMNYLQTITILAAVTAVLSIVTWASAGTAAGNSNYLKKTKKITVTVKVK